MGKARWLAHGIGAACCAALAFVACGGGSSGDDDDSFVPYDGGKDDAGVPDISPDAAPSLNCPAQCLPPAPAGWTGPSALFDQFVNGSGPTCATPYGVPDITGNRGWSGAPATCGCGSPAASGGICSISIQPSTAADCSSGSATTYVSAAGAPPCADVSGGSYARLGALTLLDAGVCRFTASKNIPTAQSGDVDVACGLGAALQCSAQRPDCTSAPTPADPFTRVCIHQDGDVSCPSLDYAHKLLVYKSVSDTRDCSACTGAPDGGCGTGGIIGLQDTGCMFGAGIKGGLPSNACLSMDAGLFEISSIQLNISPLSECKPDPTAGQPTGSVQGGDPVTFCCNQ